MACAIFYIMFIFLHDRGSIGEYMHAVCEVVWHYMFQKVVADPVDER